MHGTCRIRAWVQTQDGRGAAWPAVCMLLLKEKIVKSRPSFMGLVGFEKAKARLLTEAPWK